ncbi:hypothetical protein BC835DRAFT_1424523 [Cytidiella melzeri]|nr:hypothetical protein BC835DRAFT_1424523 [Cytidiella melzeri]
MKDEAKRLFQHVAKTNTDHVRRVAPFQYYQTLYYESRMLETFNERWNAACREAAERGALKPHQLTIRQQVVKEFWDKESPEERQRVHDQAEADFQQRLAAANRDQAAPITLEEYDQSLTNVAPFLKAITEGLAERTGMVISILLAGPIPSDQGRIGMRSFHHGVTNGFNPLNWPQYDRASFDVVEASMIKFAAAAFSAEERSRRALSPSDSSRQGSPSGPSRQPSPAAAEAPTAGSDPAGDLEQPEPEMSQPPTPTSSSHPATPPSHSTPSATQASASSRLGTPAEPVQFLSPATPAQQLPSRPSATPAELTLPSWSVTPQPPPPSQPVPAAVSAVPVASTSPPVPAPIATQVSSSGAPSQPEPTVPQGSRGRLYTHAHRSAASASSYLTLTQQLCPPVLLKAFEPLTSADYCLEWGECVAAFVKQQVASCFADPNGNIIPHDARPDVYKTWFKKGRPVHGPELPSHREFLDELIGWWWAVQPDVRGDDGRARPEESDPSDWCEIIKPGRNGVFLFLAGLMWVGRAIFEHGEDSLRADWSVLVQDITWVLLHDINYTDASVSRKRTASKPDKGSRKRAR